ncbi:MAG: hypothetical protein KC425_15645 [Anaerolineales bacterium]|nr:hypothetical protein [Anaerolineales bacterium]
MSTLQNAARLNRHADTLDRIHLLYLGLLPALATAAALQRDGYRFPFLLFIAGVAAVGVYLAATYSYTPRPKSLPATLWVLLDGPLFVLAGRGVAERPFAFAIDAFLVDGSALWLAILWLALFSDLPGRGQRTASVGIMLVALGVTASLFWPYLQESFGGRPLPLAGLLFGIAEGAFMRVRLLGKGAVLRPESDFSILYIALLVMAWVGALALGLGLHETG